MGLFDTGAQTFIGWVSGIVPKVLLLLILMNTIIALVGQDRINKFAKVCSKNVILAYGVLPFIAAFMLGNQWRFLWVNSCRNARNQATMHQQLITATKQRYFPAYQPG